MLDLDTLPSLSDDQLPLFDTGLSTDAVTLESRPVNDVAIGYLYSDSIASGFHGSLLEMMWADQHGSDAPNRIGALLPIHAGVNISGPRNDLVRAFLNTTQTWLLMIDADMTFPATLIEQFLEHANAETTPVIGGLCFGQAQPTDGISIPIAFPTLYDWVRDDETGSLEMHRFNDYPENTLVRVGATGAACLFVHRAVFEYCRTPEFEPFPWFSEGQDRGRYVGEDISFFMRLRNKVPVHVHTGIKLGHQKTWLVDEDVYKFQRSLDWPLPGSPLSAVADDNDEGEDSDE